MYEKCEATGKRSIPTMSEAVNLMHSCRRNIVDKITGARIKHRRKKPKLKRAYNCTYCDGYHLTKWTFGGFKKYFEKYEELN